MFSEKGAENLLAPAVQAAFSFARMTTDDEENWENDPNAFVADEDDEMINYSVRATCVDFVIVSVLSFGFRDGFLKY